MGTLYTRIRDKGAEPTLDEIWFFNTNMSTTTGSYKMGDVESGATMTVHFKTMPYSNNKFNFTEPFMVYDMWAEISHNGDYHVEHLIKAEEHLKTKSIFVLWH